MYNKNGPEKEARHATVQTHKTLSLVHKVSLLIEVAKAPKIAKKPHPPASDQDHYKYSQPEGVALLRVQTGRKLFSTARWNILTGLKHIKEET